MSQFADQLRRETAAVRLHRTKFGTSKAFSKEQKQRAAEVFDAQAGSISSSKKLLNTKDERYREVTKVLSHATATWVYFTTPYTEKGIRLIRRNRIDEFNTSMQRVVGPLDQALAGLADAYYDLREHARRNLVNLFNEADYPETLSDKFSIAWDFPSIEPPAYLEELNPAIYRAEQERIRARFEEAVVLAEQSFADEFQKLVGSIVQTLTVPDKNGVQKSIREDSVENLQRFFQRFKELNISSNAALDELVEQAKNCVGGANARSLNNDNSLRYVVGESLKMVSERIEGMLVDRPRRLISLHDED